MIDVTKMLDGVGLDLVRNLLKTADEIVRESECRFFVFINGQYML